MPIQLKECLETIKNGKTTGPVFTKTDGTKISKMLFEFQ